MSGKLTLWLAAVLAIVGLAGAAYFQGRADGKRVVQAEWAAEKSDQQKHLAETTAAYRSREQRLAEQVNQITEEKNRAVNDLEQRVAVLSDRVRKFAERPDVPSTTKTAAAGKDRSCTCGPVIYRPDAEFLGQEAQRAEKLRLSLLACQQQYEAAANAQSE